MTTLFGAALFMAVMMVLCCAKKCEHPGLSDGGGLWLNDTDIMAGAFADCDNIRNVTFGPGVKNIGEAAFSKCTSLREIDFGGVETIGKSAFIMCVLLESVDIPDSTVSVGKMAFATCFSLRKATIGAGLDELPVQIFLACSDLHQIKIGPNVRFIRKKALSLTGLFVVDIPDSVVEIMDDAFSQCAYLFSVKFGAKVGIIGSYAFYRNVNLKEVVLPPVLQKISNAAFKDCRTMTKITIPPSVKIIDAAAFRENRELKEIVGGTSVERIGYEAFHGCFKLPITLGSFISLKVIDPLAFSSCTSMTHLQIGDWVEQIGDSAFLGCSKLSSAHINSLKLGFGVAVFSETPLNTSDIHYNKLMQLTTYEKAGPVVALQRVGDVSGCKAGYGNNMTESMVYFNCIECSAGSSSEPATKRGCSLCKEGTYSPRAAEPLCTGCEEGKSSSRIGATDSAVCKPCEKGSYGATKGLAKCVRCPPGAYCASEGARRYKECPIGSYAGSPSRETCQLCDAGLYQNSTGQPSCDPCEAGMFSSTIGAKNSSVCLPCPPGTYGDKGGLGACITCTEGMYQPNSAGLSCKSCTRENKLHTSNAQHTGCIVNEDLLSRSVVEIIFTDGVAWCMTFVIATAFVAACAYMQLKREDGKHKIGHLGRRNVIKSALPGFSFASELFLIIGLLSEAPGVGVAMLVFRLTHLVAGTWLTVILFGSNTWAKRFSMGMEWVLSLRDDMNRDFCKSSLPAVTAVVLISVCDITLIQFLPWNKSAFYESSLGFPSLSLMKFVMGLEIVQSFVSVVCQVSYLLGDSVIDNPIESEQAQALFALSITSSILGAVVGTVFMCLKGELLNETEEKGRKAKKKELSINGLDLGDIYGDDDVSAESGTRRSLQIENPMRVEAAAAREDEHQRLLAEKDSEIERQRKRIEELESGTASSEL